MTCKLHKLQNTSPILSPHPVPRILLPATRSLSLSLAILQQMTVETSAATPPTRKIKPSASHSLPSPAAAPSTARLTSSPSRSASRALLSGGGVEEVMDEEEEGPSEPMTECLGERMAKMMDERAVTRNWGRTR